MAEEEKENVPTPVTTLAKETKEPNFSLQTFFKQTTSSLQIVLFTKT
jgi:hypothetical protein